MAQSKRSTDAKRVFRDQLVMAVMTVKADKLFGAKQTGGYSSLQKLVVSIVRILVRQGSLNKGRLYAWNLCMLELYSPILMLPNF